MPVFLFAPSILSSFEADSSREISLPCGISKSTLNDVDSAAGSFFSLFFDFFDLACFSLTTYLPLALVPLLLK